MSALPSDEIYADVEDFSFISSDRTPVLSVLVGGVCDEGESEDAEPFSVMTRLLMQRMVSLASFLLLAYVAVRFALILVV